MVEITRNQATKRWHTHLHLIVDGEFIHQKRLSAAWLKATGDSDIVDIRAVHDRKKVANYVAEYVAKPQALHTWEAESILEFAGHMHGRRMVATFGKFHATNIDPVEKEPESVGKKYVGDTVSLAERAAKGNVRARRACEILYKLGPLWQMALGVDPSACVASSDEIDASEWKEVHAAFGPEIELSLESPVVSSRSDPGLFHSGP